MYLGNGINPDPNIAPLRNRCFTDQMLSVFLLVCHEWHSKINTFRFLNEFWFKRRWPNISIGVWYSGGGGPYPLVRPSLRSRGMVGPPVFFLARSKSVPSLDRWADLKLEPINFQGISYYSAPKKKPLLNSLNEVFSLFFGMTFSQIYFIPLFCPLSLVTRTSLSQRGPLPLEVQLFSSLCHPKSKCPSLTLGRVKLGYSRGREKYPPETRLRPSLTTTEKIEFLGSGDLFFLQFLRDLSRLD